MRVVVAVASVLMLSASAASAQSPFGVFGGYMYSHPDFENPRISMGNSLKGWDAGLDVPLVGLLGVIARVDGGYGNQFRQGVVVNPLGNQVRSTLFTATAGPRVAAAFPGLTWFADGLFGVAHGRARSMGIDALSVDEDTAFVAGAGGGVDVRIRRAVDVRADFQYRRTMLFDQTLNVVQVAAGIIVKPTRR